MHLRALRHLQENREAHKFLCHVYEYLCLQLSKIMQLCRHPMCLKSLTLQKQNKKFMKFDIFQNHRIRHSSVPVLV